MIRVSNVSTWLIFQSQYNGFEPTVLAPILRLVKWGKLTRYISSHALPSRAAKTTMRLAHLTCPTRNNFPPARYSKRGPVARCSWWEGRLGTAALGWTGAVWVRLLALPRAWCVAPGQPPPTGFSQSACCDIALSLSSYRALEHTYTTLAASITWAGLEHHSGHFLFFTVRSFFLHQRLSVAGAVVLVHPEVFTTHYSGHGKSTLWGAEETRGWQGPREVLPPRASGSSCGSVTEAGAEPGRPVRGGGISAPYLQE